MKYVKSMSGLNVKKLDKVDPVGEIGSDHVKGAKEAIDEGAKKFWAKRGMADPSSKNISYGAKTTKSDSTT